MIDSERKGMKIRGKVLAFAVGIVLATAFVLVGFPYLMFATIESWVTSRLGLDYYSSRFLSTTIVVALAAGVPALAWYLILGKRKIYGGLALIGIQAAICVLVYTVGASVCFDRRTGKPLCYYADTSAGRIWSHSPGFEPRSGKPFILYTREIKAAEDSKK